jgi:16S rRNA (guanine527-N7)-methyltransferase
MDLLSTYFPQLTDAQKALLNRLPQLYEEWNAKINVISRKDVENITERHILHSLSLSFFVPFPKGATILDIGTGGGFPGIPLAILYPDCSFTLADSIGKKIKVVQEIATACGLKNVTPLHCHSSELKGRFDFVVSRAVCPLDELVKMVSKNLDFSGKGGIAALKGGDLTEELKGFGSAVKEFSIAEKITLPFFETKKVVLLSAKALKR